MSEAVAHPPGIGYILVVMLVLGLETSCDETAAAVVRDDRTILSNVVFSQLDEHRPFGGVVPEIAARAHVEHLDGIVAQAMLDAGVTFDSLDGIAATAGPGLIGGIMVGATMGKTLALGASLPFVAVNHLEGHALTARLTDAVAFPYLLLLASGGHCQLLAVDGVGHYDRLGGTIDDAVGEAFDKTAKLLGLGSPGGPAVEAAAVKAKDPPRFDLPRPLVGRPGSDFSFAGLKTAVRHIAESLPETQGGQLHDDDVADLCAAFQTAVADVLVDRSRHALQAFAGRRGQPNAFVVAGGVAANRQIRAALHVLAPAEGIPVAMPPPALCTDNAAMIAWAGLERMRLGLTDALDFKPRPRWPLTELNGAGAAG